MTVYMAVCLCECVCLCSCVYTQLSNLNISDSADPPFPAVPVRGGDRGGGGDGVRGLHGAL